MRKLLAVSAILTLTAFNAFSNNVVIEKIAKSQKLVPSCPTCDGGVLVTKTVLTYSMESCATFLSSDFDLLIQNQVVSIAFKPGRVDCMGPTALRTYSLSTLELEGGLSYTFLNPIRW